MTEFALDASAVIAFLLGERGGDIVEPVLAQSSMTTVNLSEVVAHFARKAKNHAEIQDMLRRLPIAFVPFDEALAFDAGMLIKATKPAGLSFGDRACLALARSRGAKVLTADRAWARIASIVDVEIEVIR